MPPTPDPSEPGPDAPPPPADRHDADAHGLHRAIRAVSSVTLLSRFAGLVREVLVSRLFGDTALGSAFGAAFQIPNLFRRLFGEGALSAAFIPAYSASTDRDARHDRDPAPHPPASADKFASLTLAMLGVITGALVVVAEIVLLTVLLFGSHPLDRQILLHLVVIMLPFMPLICCAAILAGMLQVHGRFAPASAGPLLLNAFIIAVAAFFLLTNRAAGATVAYVLGVATVLSGLTQCLWFLRLLRPRVTWTLDYRDAVPEVRAMLRRFVPVAIGLGTLQLSTFLDTLICTYTIWAGPTFLGFPFPLQDKSNAIVVAAQRLYQFPLGVFGIAVATAVFPLLSRFAASPAPDSQYKFRRTVWRGVRLSLFIAVPSSVGLILIRHHLAFVLFAARPSSSSGFSPDGVDRVSNVLLGFAPGIWIYSLNHVLSRAYYARGDMRTPMFVSIAMILVNLALTFALIWNLAEAGLAWSTTICAAFQLLALASLTRRWRRSAPAETPTASPTLGVAPAVSTTAASALVMVAAVLGVQAILPPPTGWTAHAIALAVMTATGAFSYLLAARLFRSQDLADLLSRSRMK
ncbi:MAG: murein biosynthesis integral membrane protein MurJ [Phycisphaerales bacterium]